MWWLFLIAIFTTYDVAFASENWVDPYYCGDPGGIVYRMYTRSNAEEGGVQEALICRPAIYCAGVEPPATCNPALTGE